MTKQSGDPTELKMDEFISKVLSELRRLNDYRNMARTGASPSQVRTNKTESLKKRIELMELLISTLSENERFVVQHRFIENMTWDEVVEAHVKRWGDCADSTRSLMRFMRSAIEKITGYILEFSPLFEKHFSDIDDENGDGSTKEVAPLDSHDH